VRARVRPWLLIGLSAGLLSLFGLWAARLGRRQSKDDLGAAIVKLLGYVGDLLSGYQEAIAKEGVLASAQGRRSIGARTSRQRSARRRCRS
jgi:hypothetical protein